MFSSFFRATDSTASNSGGDGFFTKFAKRVLYGLKVITSGAQAFFGIRETTNIITHKQTLSSTAYIPTTTCALLSAGYIAAIRYEKMLRPSSKPQPIQQNVNSSPESMGYSTHRKKPLAFSDLSLLNKMLYCVNSSLAYSACFFFIHC